MYPQFQSAVPVYNNFSPDLLNSIPKTLDPNKPILFRQLRPGKPLELTETALGSRPEQIIARPNANLPIQESILDPGTSQYITLAFFPGAMLPTSVPESVVFPRDADGILCVPAKEKNKFLRLMLSNFNKDCCNPQHVAPTGGYLFEMVQPEKSAAEQYELELSIDQAKEAVHLADVSQLKRLAPKLGIAVSDYQDEKASQLKLDFIAKAKANPALVLQYFDADDEKLFRLVDRAVKAEVVVFDAETTSWRLVKDRAFLTTVLPGTKHEDALAKFLIETPVLKKAIEAATTQKEKK